MLSEQPVFEDPFEAYGSSLQKVLPHLIFTGVDSKRRALLFDTTGIELTFDQLSGGEREIAFLVGQIDRFGLRDGLFLIDEPELHLNSDLIRTWVSYLTSTVSVGQIWLATHSLEAVEAAGQHATFILEKNDSTKKVDGVARLDSRPVLSALSRAVGTPAFSIARLRFIFVEGEDGIGERERFRMLTASGQSVRFMECGSCNEVTRRVSAIKALASETQSSIRVGGFMDRDFKSAAEISKIQSDSGVFVLGVHEVENLFLNPNTLSALGRQNGLDHIVPAEIIRAASDARAGCWIFQNAMATSNARNLPDVQYTSKEVAKALKWTDFDATDGIAIQRIVDASGFDENSRTKFAEILRISVSSYREKRSSKDFWKNCEGKQVLQLVSRSLGFSDSTRLAGASYSLWSSQPTLLPSEVSSLRQYLTTL